MSSVRVMLYITIHGGKLKTYAVWMLITWFNNQGVVIQDPYYPNYQECEVVRKTIDEMSPTAHNSRCVRVDILQSVEHLNTTR